MGSREPHGSKGVRRAGGGQPQREARAGAAAAPLGGHALDDDILPVLGAAVSHAKDAIVVTAFEPRQRPLILFVNPAFCRMTGYAADEVVGRRPPILEGPKTDRSALERVQENLARNEATYGETVAYRKDGSEFLMEWHISPISGEDGVTHSVSILRDISARKRNEEELAALLEVAKDVSGTLDLAELLDRVQRKAAELLPCDGVVTLSFDAGSECFRVIGQHGMLAENAERLAAARFRAGTLFGGRLMAGETVVIARPDDIPESADLLRSFPLFAMIVTPLIVRGRVVGAFAGFRRGEGASFTADRVRLFESIGRQLAVALEAAELYRAQQEDAEVFRALVRVGQEMNSSLDLPVLLDRLCVLTAEVLGCDFSHVILAHGEGENFTVAAGHGDTAEHAEALRVLQIPPPMIERLLARLERDEVVQIVMTEPQDLLPAALPKWFGITVGLYVALRRRGDLIGGLTAGYRGREAPFTPQQERTARGIAQIASLALENARLVDELERANRLKADFVATMSHELRTPLNVIIGYNDLLLENILGPLVPKQADALRRVYKNARELLELINATLDLSRLETGRQLLDLSEFAVADLVADLDAETRELRESKPELYLRWDVAGDLPPLRSDRVKLRVVVKNLIGNAFKFTNQGGVTVAVGRSGAGIEIRVTDTGIGIAPEMAAVIFEAFRQVDSSARRVHGGVGLGLYIVQRLATMLGGTIRVESELGRGSTFVLRVSSVE